MTEKYLFRLTVKNNEINIGNNLISFPIETKIDKILYSEISIWFNTCPSEEGLDWDKIETHQIWKNRCDNNPCELFCFSINGLLKWKFVDYQIVGFGRIIPELKKEDFISPEHFRKYIQKFKGKELLEVYAGNFRFILDANTGEIYDKMESR
jgi:hypothetical protein